MSQQRPRQRKYRFYHKCDLPYQYHEDVLPEPGPYASIFAICLYRFRTMYTIQTNYATSRYFRSQKAFIREKVRHLTNENYRYVIHPLSNFARIHEVYMTFVWMSGFVLPPYLGSFAAKEHFGSEQSKDVGWFALHLILYVLNFSLLMDFIIRFRLGYIDNKTREIVLDPKQIRNNYLKTYFFFDFFAFWCSFVARFVPISFTKKLILYQMNMLRLVRITWLKHGTQLFLRWVGIGQSISSALVVYVYWGLYVHFWGCLFKFINVLRDDLEISYEDSWLNEVDEDRHRLNVATIDTITDDLPYILEYFHYLSLVLCHFFGSGVGYFKSKNDLERMLLSLLLVISAMIILWSTAILIQYFGIVNMSESRYDELYSQAQEFMIMKQFPPKLRNRIGKFYDYKFDKKFFSEDTILDSLSPHLQMETLLYSYRHMVERVNLFRGLSKSAVGCILALLKQEIYLPNDVIMRADDESGTLYFILYGTCGVMLLSGKEAMHIEDGHHFGENREFNASVTNDFLYMIVALESCEIYSLSAADIKYCCIQYPEVGIKIESMLVNKARQYSNILARAAAEDDRISATDILDQLRRGKILNHGRRRVRPLVSDGDT